MNISTKQIEDALSEVKIPEGDKSIWESGIVKNIQIFGTEVVLDLEINNPTLQYKKRIEVDCLKLFIIRFMKRQL